MKYTVRLDLFQDDATGDYGLAHSNAIYTERPFNAFWTQQGIFHDVFEHYFEDRHKYFRGDYAFNIGGEVAAMGHFLYYMHKFYPSDRLFNPLSHFSLWEMAIGGTEGEMEEAITCSWSNFGDQLLCRVPRQRFDDYELNNTIYEHYSKIKSTKVGKYVREPEEREFGKIYKKSVTLGKLRDLYTWGYKQAEKIAPRNDHNRHVIEDFLSTWKRIVNENKAEDLYNMDFRYLEFTITGGQKMAWKAKWILQDGTEIKADTPYLEDAYYEANLISEYDY